MPIHRVQLPNGQTLKIEAPDGATAMQGAQEYWAQHADPKGAQQFSAAINDARADEKQRGGGTGWQNIVHSAMLGAGDELDAMGAANKVRLQNFMTYFGGKAPQYTPDQAARATKQVYDENLQQYRAQHPHQALATNIGGGFLTPGIGELFGWAGGAPTMGGKMLRGAIAGAGQGAAYGGLDAENGHRAQGAVTGGAIGGTLGFVTPPVAGAVGGALSRMIPRKPAEQALDMAAKDLRLAGDNAAQRMANNPELTFAEATGRRGMSRARDLGRMDGLDSDIGPVMQDRIDNTPNAINRGFESATGVVPEDAEFNLQQMTKAGQQAAKPLYKSAYGQIVDTPGLRSVLQRPAVRDALKPAAELLLNSGEAPHVTIDTMHLPESLPTGEVQGDNSGYLSDVMEWMRGGVKRAGKAMGPSLSDHLAALGGLADETGDLAAFDAQRQLQNPGVGLLKKLVRPGGMPYDKAAEKAFEGGYFSDLPDQRQLLDAIRRESAGKPMTSMHAPPADPRRAQFLQGLDQRISELDLPPNATPRQIAQALADQDAQWQHLQDWADGKHGGVSPVAIQERVPSMQHLDYVKRHLDQEIRLAEKHGKTETAQALRDARSALVGELRDNNPAYAKALDTSSDYLRNSDAFNKAGRQFQASNTAYESYVSGLSEPEKHANLQGLLSDFNKRLNSQEGGPPSLNFLLSPNARAKLAIATRHLGPKVADEIRQSVANAAEIRANAKAMVPPAIAKQLGPAQLEALRQLGIDHVPATKHGLFLLIGRAIAKIGGNVYNAAQFQASKPALQEYARLLVQNGNVTMRDIAKMPPSPVKALFQSASRNGLRAIPMINAGVAGGPPPSPPPASPAAPVVPTIGPQAGPPMKAGRSGRKPVSQVPDASHMQGPPMKGIG